VHALVLELPAEKVPAEQAVHVDEATPADLPAGHWEQLVPPVKTWTVPAAHLEQADDEPEDAMYSPAEHAVQLVAPFPAWNLPGAQAEQAAAPVVDEYLPWAQDAHALVAAPVVARKVPDAQREQADWPGSVWYEPGAQSLQAAAAVMSEYLPAAHALALEEPWGQKEPFGHAVAEVASQNEPAGQAAQAPLPDTNWYWPETHAVQLVAPLAAAMEPAAQGEHAALPLAEYEPGWQFWQALAPAFENWPAMHGFVVMDAAAQNEPAGQEVAVVALQEDPTGQFAQ